MRSIVIGCVALAVMMTACSRGESGAIFMKVVVSGDGRPAHARGRALREFPRWHHTDDQGNLLIDGLFPDVREVELIADLDGTDGGASGGVAVARAFAYVNAGQTANIGTISLARPGDVAGKIEFPRGAAIPDEPLLVAVVGQSAAGLTNITKYRHEFRVSGVTPGWIRLAAVWRQTVQTVDVQVKEKTTVISPPIHFANNDPGTGTVRVKVLQLQENRGTPSVWAVRLGATGTPDEMNTVPLEQDPGDTSIFAKRGIPAGVYTVVAAPEGAQMWPPEKRNLAGAVYDTGIIVENDGTPAVTLMLVKADEAEPNDGSSIPGLGPPVLPAEWKDDDKDGVGNNVDNCDCYNPGQEDADFDGFADACDNCPFVRNATENLGGGCAIHRKAGDSCSCGPNRPCPAPLFCVDRVCVACTTSADCEASQSCDNGACVNQCKTDGDCAPRVCDGKTGTCVLRCEDHDDCGPNRGCKDGSCRRLSIAGQCPEGMKPLDADPRYCIPECKNDDECKSQGRNATCRAGNCVPPDFCNVDAECSLRRPGDQTGPVGRRMCAAGIKCVPRPTSIDTSGLYTCDDYRDCVDGEFCNEAEGPVGHCERDPIEPTIFVGANCEFDGNETHPCFKDLKTAVAEAEKSARPIVAVDAKAKISIGRAMVLTKTTIVGGYQTCNSNGARWVRDPASRSTIDSTSGSVFHLKPGSDLPMEVRNLQINVAGQSSHGTVFQIDGDAPTTIADNRVHDEPGSFAATGFRVSPGKNKVFIERNAFYLEGAGAGARMGGFIEGRWVVFANNYVGLGGGTGDAVGLQMVGGATLLARANTIDPGMTSLSSSSGLEYRTGVTVANLISNIVGCGGAPERWIVRNLDGDVRYSMPEKAWHHNYFWCAASSAKERVSDFLEMDSSLSTKTCLGEGYTLDERGEGCIDKGPLAVDKLIPTDIDGKRRIDVRTDIGCWEWEHP